MLKKKLFGSLAFRVLFSSFVFVVIPLVIYALFIYNRDYEEKLHDVFQEMHIFQKDQADFILQLQNSNLNFLDSFYHLVSLIEETPNPIAHDKLDLILKKFATRENLSAIFYLSVTKDASLLCKHSTLKEYLNINFSTYFDLDYLSHINGHIFINKDPIFQYSLFITFPVINDSNQITGIVGASISLAKLVYELNTIRRIYDANITITDHNNSVLVSTNPNHLGKQFLEVSDLKAPLSPYIIPIKEVPSVNHGFEFYQNHERRFLTISRFPHTKANLILTVPANVVLIELYKSLWQLASLLAFILILGGITSYLLTIRFAKPLKTLSDVMGQVGEGHLDARFHKDHLGFEINYLGEQFNQMVTSLIDYIEQVNKERASKEVYLKELQIGHEIQKSILPEGTITFPHIEAAIFFKPAKEVAGDFYDWMIKGDNLLITIADGVGKGISGCLYSFDLRSVLRTFSSMSNSLSEIATKTNTIFCQDTKETGNFVTAFLALYNAPTQELSYTNCGHNYPILKRANGTLERLETPGMAFGIEAFDFIHEKKVKLEQNDFVIFYTDGLTDAQDTHHKLFSETRLIEIIDHGHYSTPEELVHLINLEISLFTKEEEQFDDMTLIILKIT